MPPGRASGALGHAPVAVATADLALRDLPFQRHERDVEHHPADLPALGPDVIELEDEHVTLPAVDALSDGQDAV